MKQTEIGLIPEDWEVKSLGEILTIKHGYGFEGDSFSAEDNGFIVVTPGNFKLNGGFQKPQASIFYIGKYPKEFNLKPNDLVIMMTDLSKESDTLGNPAIIPDDNYQYLHNQRIGLINCNSDNFDKNYLFHLLCSKDYHKAVVSTAAGSTVKHTSPKRIYTIKLPITQNLQEQQRIAKALSDVDALISTTEKLIQKKKNIKQGTMQNLLTGKKRLPGFTKSSNYKQTEIGLIPEDWEVKSLGEIFEFRPNNTFTRDCLNDSKGKYQNVHYGDVLIKYPSILDCSKETIPFINEGINVKFSKYGIVEGDIIIADTAEDETVGKVVEVFNLGEKKIVSGLHTFLCRKITDDFAPKWLGYFMNQAIFHNQLLPFITGTKVSAISRTAIQNVKVLIPSKEEQTAIANVLSSMDKEIETLNTKLEKYRNLKTAMMQQLLTGKIRLR